MTAGEKYMSNFSQTLKNYVSTQGIPIQTLSKLSGVDRSFIQHMLAGNRVPADITVLEKIMKAMMLTPGQERRLRHLYHVDRVGQEIYKRHLMVKDLLENIDASREINALPVKINYQHDFSNFPPVNILYGINEINRIVKAVVEAESAKENGYIKLIVQPEYSFLLELLLAIGSNSNLHIEHVFCLQKEIPLNSDNYLNLSYIKNVMPLLLSVSDYNASIYYDDLEVKFNETSIFPYFIVTSDKVITISHNFNYAALFLSEDIHHLYHTIYNDVFRVSSPLVERIYDPMEFYNRYSLLESGPGESKSQVSSTYSLFSQPCFMYFASKEQFNKYIYDFPLKDEIVALMADRADNYYQLLVNGYEFTSYFTEEGLDYFWTSGRITEIPDAFYSPVEKQDCLKLMEHLYRSILNTSYRAIAVNPDEFKIASNLVISAVNEALVFFMYVHPKKGPFHLVFHEKSIAYSIFTFIDYLKDSELVFSKERSLEILERKIHQYKAELP
jgi:hypothetical protein